MALLGDHPASPPFFSSFRPPAFGRGVKRADCRQGRDSPGNSGLLRESDWATPAEALLRGVRPRGDSRSGRLENRASRPNGCDAARARAGEDANDSVRALAGQGLYGRGSACDASRGSPFPCPKPRPILDTRVKAKRANRSTRVVGWMVLIAQRSASPTRRGVGNTWLQAATLRGSRLLDGAGVG